MVNKGWFISHLTKTDLFALVQKTAQLQSVTIIFMNFLSGNVKE